MSERPWTSQELKVLQEQRAQGAAKIAALLDRSVGSVRAQAHRQRITLRTPNTTRGLVLGQPRGLTLKGTSVEEYAHLVAIGALDPSTLVQRAELNARIKTPELCPRCTRRPIRVQRVGLCRVCHLETLTEAHNEELAELEAQRELDATRQRKKRLKDGLED